MIPSWWINVLSCLLAKNPHQLLELRRWLSQIALKLSWSLWSSGRDLRRKVCEKHAKQQKRREENMVVPNCGCER